VDQILEHCLTSRKPLSSNLVVQGKKKKKTHTFEHTEKQIHRSWASGSVEKILQKAKECEGLGCGKQGLLVGHAA
jgi:hypothetical protein